MRRRDLVTVLAGAAAYPLLAGAQQKAMPVIGYLGAGSPSAAPMARIPSGTEGNRLPRRTVVIEYRSPRETMTSCLPWRPS